MTHETDQPEHVKRQRILHEIWAFIRIMNVRLRFIFLMIIVGLVAGHWDSIMNHYDRWTRPAQAPEVMHQAQIEYYCAMHPNIIRGEPGNCPICGMPLVNAAKTVAAVLPEGVLSRIQLTPLKIEMGRISTSPVEFRLLAREIRTVGIIDYDETRQAFITSRVKGRIDKLMVNYVGQRITQGDPMVSIYSPDLVVAQEELLSAVRAQDHQRDANELMKSQMDFLILAAKKKLILWGISEPQIKEIIRRNKPETHLTLYSPISGIVTEKNILQGEYVEEGTRIYTIADLATVWMQAKIFEDQIAGIKLGTAVEVASTAFPNETFAGRITFIAFTVDPATRTLAARVEIANPDYKLKPGMYGNAAIRLPVGAVTELAAVSQPSSEPDDLKTNTYGLTRAYLDIASAYAKDTADTAVIEQFIQGAKSLADQGEGDFKTRVLELADLAQKLRSKDLQEQRTVFKTLSEKMIQFLKSYPPANMNLYVIFCPMANASWVSDKNEVVNPYYGKEMPTCGQVSGRIGPRPARAAERYVMGFYCPIYPDRVFDKAQVCPIDKFPYKFARIEKVLAVPEFAVIDTGTRKIVYRQSNPGTFDMLEVTVGPRAGEFYPVLAGLKPDDQVATVGAFLVDAENRLNPAASAQYFGASGGPQEHHHH